MRSIKIYLSVLVIVILAACAAPTPAPEVSQAEIDKALNIILTEGAMSPVDAMGNPSASTRC